MRGLGRAVCGLSSGWLRHCGHSLPGNHAAAGRSVIIPASPNDCGCYHPPYRSATRAGPPAGRLVSVVCRFREGMSGTPGRIPAGTPAASGPAALPRCEPGVCAASEDLPQSLYAGGPWAAAPGAGAVPAHRPAGAQAAAAAGRTRGTTPGMIMISGRPAGVADRAVPGHGEGDLITGDGGQITTLAGRSARYVMPARISDGKAATLSTAQAGPAAAAARAPAEAADLGSGPGTGRARRLHRRHRHPGVPPRPALTPGSAAPMRTPPACCASTPPRAPA
jgi:hypothetical protein